METCLPDATASLAQTTDLDSTTFSSSTTTDLNQIHVVDRNVPYFTVKIGEHGMILNMCCLIAKSATLLDSLLI
jgi:hypothetical protein